MSKIVYWIDKKNHPVSKSRFCAIAFKIHLQANQP